MAEYDDPMYDAVFNTAGGKLALLGFGTAAATFFPALAIGMSMNNDAYYRSQVLEIKSQEQEVAILQDASDTLVELGDTHLAKQLQEKAASLTNSISTAQENLPSHLGYDIFLYGSFAVPLVLGGLAGAIRYKKLKKAA